MSKMFQRKRVALSELGYSARSDLPACKTRRDFVELLTGEGNGDPNKALRYAKAMKQGMKFPPVVVAKVGDDLTVLDGHHRCAAAASCGHETISAVVFEAVSSLEADVILDVVSDYMDAGVPWCQILKRLEGVGATLRLMREDRPGSRGLGWVQCIARDRQRIETYRGWGA